MDLLLPPPGLKELIRDRYLAGIADAQAKYPFNAADEDALTGALGSQISMAHDMGYSDGHRQYRYQVTYQKIRGRGPGAPEKRLGADGIFQIEVRDQQGERRKGLPFQAKKEWRGKDSKLFEQVHQMVETAGDGIAIDYRSGNFSACQAMDVLQHQANQGQIVRAGKMRSLGELLADDFLDCEIGQPGLFCDPVTEKWLGFTAKVPAVKHAITTRVTEVRTD